METTQLSEDVPEVTKVAVPSAVTSIGEDFSCSLQSLQLESSSAGFKSIVHEKDSDKLLHHCLPITSLKLLEGIILVASEGPSILMKLAYFNQHPFQRYQLFPSQFIISGMEFEMWPLLEVGGDPVQWHKRSDKPHDFIYVGFIWAGNFGTVIRLTRSVKGGLRLLEFREGKCDNKLQDFDFIPVAGKWLEGGNVLALLSVLNYLVLYERVCREDTSENFTDLRELTRTFCSKSETLFSGLISGNSRNDLLIFAGTIFNGICIWNINGGTPTIRHELKCHDGIIFSLEYYSNRKLLLSTSDDRTVAVWKFDSADGEEKALLLHKFYGHDARVWKALSVHEYIISIGESSDVRVNLMTDGELHKAWRAHDGAPIFTGVYDDDFEVLYTGGNEGSIRKWPQWWYRLKPRVLPYDVISFEPETEDKSRTRGSGRWSGNEDFPKMPALLDINHALVSMESGRVIGLTWEGKQFDLLHDGRCEGYQIIKISPDHKVLAVAGKDGHFYLAEIFFTENQESKTSIMCAKKTFMTKLSWNIMTMIWLNVSRLLIICFNRAIALLLQENDKGERSEVDFIQTFDLNLQRPGVPAAVEIQGKYIILGDEIGALHLFRYHKSNTVIKVFDKAHKDGVTTLLYHDSQLYSGGRDGKVRTFSIKINSENDVEAEFIPLITFSLPFDWISGLYVNLGNMLVCGFQKEDFVVHSMNEQRTLAKIPCGGGSNRKWDFKYGHGLEGSKNASFTFVRDKEIFYTFLPMEGYLNVTMKEGLHSRSINCAVKLNSPDSKNCIGYITGSEDGSLKWFQWDVSQEKITCIQTMENHVSSVRSTWKITTAVSNQTFIFTGGGRSQLCIYELDQATGRMDLLKEIVLVKTSCKQTEGDVRVMDITVLERADNNELLCCSACSDGYVRILYFNNLTQKFKIAGLLRGNGHAVMRLQLLSHNLKRMKGEIFICGVTSNGYFILWKWNDLGDEGHRGKGLPEMKPEFEKLLRRTAFLSLKANITLSKDVGNRQSYEIVCGGDDCSVSLWSLTLPHEDDKSVKKEICMREEWLRDQNQRGAVVGVDIDDSLIYTISNDQIVSFWSLQGKLVGTQYAGVSDCQGFLVDRKIKCILCFGKGISWIPVPSFSESLIKD